MKSTSSALSAASLFAAASIIGGAAAVSVSNAPGMNAPVAKSGAAKLSVADFRLSKIMREVMHGSGKNRPVHRRGPGWTRAHVQRMARKRRNVARNRAAHRG